MKKLIILLFLSLLSQFVLQAQQQSGRPGGGGSAPSIKLVGTVLDQSTKQGLEFATISVYSKRDSSLLTGGLTGTGGTFEFDVKPSPMYAVIEFISYTTITKDIDFDRDAIRSGNRKIDMGTITMSVNSTQLDEVEITAERSEVQFSLDKRIFNVGKDLSNRGGSAEDILDNVPSVTVDIDGVVSLRGSEGVRILVDGRPSTLVGGSTGSGLKNIPANLIETIEVITNPSARYEASGMAGIINIVLKKNDGSGFNGSFDASVGYPEQVGFGANINYRKNKLNWFANYSIRNRTGPRSGFTFSERTNPDFVEILDSQRESSRGGLSNSIRLGADYFITEKDQITGSFTYRISDDNNLSTIDMDSFLRVGINPDNQFLNNTLRTDNETEDETSIEYNINYRKEFSSKNHTLNAMIQYEDELEGEGSLFDEQFTPAGESTRPSLVQRSNNDESYKNWLFQVDYSKPLGKDHKYEIGYRTSLRDITNDYIVEELNAADEYEVLLFNGQLFENQFLYDENIHALYATYGNKYGKFSYQAGLRGEYSQVTTIETNQDKVNDRDYLDLFPSLHLNYQINESRAYQLSYSRRIDRPRFWFLNPFFTLSDRINTFSGNPDLDPEYTDSYELGTIRYWDDFSLNTSLFYRHTEDNIDRFLVLNDDGTTTRRPENVGVADDYGLDLNFSYSGLKWLRLDANGNFFRATSSGTFQDTDFEVDNFTWFGRFTARISFWDSDLQIRSDFRGARQTAQGSTLGRGSVDLGWSKDFMNDNLTIALSIRDIFNSRNFNSTVLIDDESTPDIAVDFFSMSRFQRRARSTTLSVNYRINQKKKRQRGGRGGGGDDGGGEF